jgi:hypothetical protein
MNINERMSAAGIHTVEASRLFFFYKTPKMFL